jgi:hypothetical protein
MNQHIERQNIAPSYGAADHRGNDCSVRRDKRHHHDLTVHGTAASGNNRCRHPTITRGVYLLKSYPFRFELNVFFYNENQNASELRTTSGALVHQKQLYRHGVPACWSLTYLHEVSWSTPCRLFSRGEVRFRVSMPAGYRILQPIVTEKSSQCVR